MWVGVDIIGTMLHGDIVVHSADGRRVLRRLRRVASKLGFDRQGETLFRGVVTDAMNGPRIACARSEAGIEFRTHWVIAPDGTAVGLVVWLAPPPVAPRPIYNSAIMDLQHMATAATGDDLDLYGVERAAGERKPIMQVLRHMTPDDAPAWAAMTYKAEREPEGVTVDTVWSIRPEREWVHLWTSVTNLGAPGPQRAVYGLTVNLPHRTVDTRLGTLVRYTGATLLMVDVHTRVVRNASGDLADILITDEQRLANVLTQIDLERLTGMASIDPVVEQTISIEGSLFQSAMFTIPTGPVQPGAAIAILLVPASDRRR